MFTNRQGLHFVFVLSWFTAALLTVGCASPNSAAAPSPVAPATGALSGQIVKDVNGNGQVDPGEPFLVSADVSCSNSEALAGLAVTWTGAAVGTTTVAGCNAAGGFFRAESLIAGSYAVNVTIPQGWTGIRAAANLTVNAGSAATQIFFLQPPTPTPAPAPAPPSTQTVVRTATFQGANGYTTSGTAEVVRAGLTFTLELREDFRTSNGGILEVRLCRESDCTGGDLTLGRLDIRSGKQTYALGGNDTSSYRYVVIYCTAINRPFGYGLFR